MKRLFVDCDDTLALFEGEGIHPYGLLHGLPWKPNKPLIQRIKDFRAKNPDALIVIWSGGGEDYARVWMERLLSDIDADAMTKVSTAMALCRQGDIVVDDQPLAGISTIGPHDDWPIESVGTNGE